MVHMMSRKCDVVVVIAHPDDEIFVSGTLCLCADAGFRTTLICVTNGEGGSDDLLYFGSDRSLSEIRREELSLSAWVLRVTQVQFLNERDVPDPEMTKNAAWDLPKLTNRLASKIREEDPQLILTHSPLGGYGHAAHGLVNSCVMAAASEISFAGSIFSFCGKVQNSFFSWHFDEHSQVLVDARPFLKRRAASLAYHQTQASFFLQPYFPGTLRKFASALFGYTFAFSEAGRKRIPIETTTRFFKRFPVEGLVLRKSPSSGGCHFFLQNFANAPQVKITR